MSPSSRMTIPDHVMVRQVGDESVMLDLANGVYFGLDAVGARVWQLFCEGRSIAEASAAISAEFEAAREDVERDVMSLAQQLADAGLVRPG